MATRYNKMKQTYNFFCRISIKFLLLILCLNAKSQEAKNLRWLEALNKAINTKDTVGIAPFLAESFSIGGHTGNGARYRLAESIKFTNKSIEGVMEQKPNCNGTQLIVAVKNNNGTISERQVRLDNNNKIIYFSLFDEIWGMDREKISRHITTIPFENIQGKIIITAYINNNKDPLRLIFDSGADGMAISEKLAKKIGLKSNRQNLASMVGGSQNISISDENSVKMGDLALDRMGIAIFPQFEDQFADGIIGNTILSRFITKIDYDNNQIDLYSFGQFEYKGNGKVVSIDMPDGLILLRANLGITKDKNVDGKFVFDTGASYSLICFRPFVRENKLLISGFKPLIHSSTFSMGVSSPTFLGNSCNFSISGLPAIKDFPITLMGGTSNNETWKPGIDGSIGVRYYSRYNLTINLGEGEIFFSPNKFNNFPQDFILKNYQFGWNNNGKLLLLNNYMATEKNTIMKVGKVVDKIGGIEAQKLKNNTVLIQNIQKLETMEIQFLDGTTFEI